RRREQLYVLGVRHGEASFGGPPQPLAPTSTTIPFKREAPDPQILIATRYSSSSESTTGAIADTSSPSRSRITITPCVERPSRLTSSTCIRITVPPVEISITW